MSSIPSDGRIYEILIAEDNPADLFLIQEALRVNEVSCRLHTVETGEEFLAYARESCKDEDLPKPDLVILDWHLPRGSGTQLIRAIRETERCADSYILVLTSSLSPHDHSEAIAAGVNQFVSKPTDLNEFLHIGAIVKAALDSSRLTLE